MDDQISYLQQQADQCRKLARSTEHRPTAAMFEKMAAEYEVEAARLAERTSPLAFAARAPEQP